MEHTESCGGGGCFPEASLGGRGKCVPLPWVSPCLPAGSIWACASYISGTPTSTCIRGSRLGKGAGYLCAATNIVPFPALSHPLPSRHCYIQRQPSRALCCQNAVKALRGLTALYAALPLIAGQGCLQGKEILASDWLDLLLQFRGWSSPTLSPHCP